MITTQLKFTQKEFKKSKEKVVVIGMGYVGFPLACRISLQDKYKVYGLDKDIVKVNKINRRISPIKDKHSEENLKKMKVQATSDSSVLKDSDYVIVCVPTPVNDDKRPDLALVEDAISNILRYLKKGQMIIIESTVNPGVCEDVVLPILESTGMKGGIDFELVHCPERINPGDNEWNVSNIPRNIGALTKSGTKKAADFYRTFVDAPINEVSSIKVAEATKIVENTFRDINIAYVNELAQLFDKMKIDIIEVINGASNKPFAFMPHYPGCGVGGHCIPVDPYYLIEKADDIDFEPRLVKAARDINNRMPKYTVKRLINALKEYGLSIKDVPIGILGLSYKADSSDARESPAFEIKKELLRQGASVVCHDPYLSEKSDATLEFILENCFGVIIATDHSQFKSIAKWGNIKVIIDGRNCLDSKKISPEIIYQGIGRGRKHKIKNYNVYPVIQSRYKIKEAIQG